MDVDDMTRFMGRIEHRDGHWLWPNWRGSGKRTPVFSVKGRADNARRIAWLLRFGELPGVPLWRTCSEQHCINPEHHRPQIGPLQRQRCNRGHLLTDDNVYMTTQGKRACRQCIRETTRRRRQRYLREGRGWGRSHRRLGDAEHVQHEQNDDDNLTD